MIARNVDFRFLRPLFLLVPGDEVVSAAGMTLLPRRVMCGALVDGETEGSGVNEFRVTERAMRSLEGVHEQINRDQMNGGVGRESEEDSQVLKSFVKIH